MLQDVVDLGLGQAHDHVHVGIGQAVYDAVRDARRSRWRGRSRPTAWYSADSRRDARSRPRRPQQGHAERDHHDVDRILATTPFAVRVAGYESGGGTLHIAAPGVVTRDWEVVPAA